MTIADEIEKLNRLRMDGAISELEFQELKSNLLHGEQTNHTPPGAPYPPPRAQGGGFVDNVQDRDWCLGMHLAQFAGYVIPVAGIIAPIIMWQIKKDQSPTIDAHGRVIANWMLTFALGCFICFLLCFIVIGIPLMFAWIICGIVFPIIGAVKAHNGELWKYPMSLRVF